MTIRLTIERTHGPSITIDDLAPAELEALVGSMEKPDGIIHVMSKGVTYTIDRRFIHTMSVQPRV